MRQRSLLPVLLCAAAFCSSDGPDAARTGTSGTPRQLYLVEGFDQPESVQYDPDQDVFFVSNMVGHGSVEDGTGYIKWFAADDPERSGVLARSGVNGVVLNAPKGLALQGDTLWAADIDVLRAFDRRSGQPLASLDLSRHGAVLLNSITSAPDGTLFVTDSGIVMSEKGVIYGDGGRIFTVEAGEVRIVAAGSELGFPNGIRWDEESGRLLVASFHPFRSEVYALPAGGGERTLVGTGYGRFDGVGVLEDGSVLATAWSDSSLYAFTDGSGVRLIHDLWQPADFAIDTRRGRIAIPLVLPGQVGIWELGSR